MTVESTARKQQFSLDGTTSTLTFTFRAQVGYEDDIKVVVTDGDGVDTDLTYTTDYTVSINSDGNGGIVTLVDPADTGSGTATVYRETTNKQLSDYDDYNQFPADTLEQDLDLRTLVAQEQQEQNDRAFRVPISTDPDVSLEVPAVQADKVLGWNSAGDALENKTFTPSTDFEKATAADAVAGTNDTKYMTPTKTTIAIAVGITNKVTGPATNADLNIPQWNGANSKTLKDGLAVGVGANNLVQLDGSAKLPAVDGSQLTGVLAFNYIKVSDTKTSGTGGGEFLAGAWRTRVINTEDTDTGGHCSIASNQITLAAGIYECFITCPAYAVDNHQTRLYNITDAVTILLGTNARANDAEAIQTHSFIIGRFTLATSKVLEIQHYCSNDEANGFGGACGFGINEIYTVAEFRRISTT